ncbi:MAG: NTP transferase domain-containing protein [Deltaproteobacteria bacterium]|nr:NTP transferase domain-containing protein [Deltaproteobacteria bacterium]
MVDRFEKAEKLEQGAGIDAIVLAGGKADRRFVVDGRPVYKPFLRLGGETLVTRAVRAALHAKEVGRVVVVGPVEALREALGPLMEEAGEGLTLLEEGEGILENMLIGFFDAILPSRGYAAPRAAELTPNSVAEFKLQHPELVSHRVLIMTSDMPFVRAVDLDRFIRMAPQEAKLVVGMLDHAELEKMQKALGDHTVLDQWKLGAMPFREVSVRLNNLWLARPLSAEPVIYDLVREVYEHRWMLKQNGSVHWANCWSIMRSFWRFSRKIKGRRRFVRGVFNLVPLLFATLLARMTLRAGRWLSSPFRFLVRRRDVEFTGSLLISTPTEMHISRDLGPAIDIDVEESYLSLSREGEEGFRRVERYLLQQESAACAKAKAREGQEEEKT